MKKLIILLVCLVFAGCSQIKYRGIEYTRIGNQELNDVLIEIKDPNGLEIGIIIEGQKSDFELGFEAAGMGVTAKGGE